MSVQFIEINQTNACNIYLALCNMVSN